MRRPAFHAVAAAAAIVVGSCTTITEDLPPTPTAPAPFIPPPGPGPTPQPGPTPTPNPTPKPTPKPGPTPTPTPGNTATAKVTAGVHSYRRNNTLYRTAADFYLPGDAIYLNCTPRDQNGQPTKNHGPLQDWHIYSNDLTVGTHFHYTDTDGFNPDLHIHTGCPDGTVKIACKVDGIWSAETPLSIHGK